MKIIGFSGFENSMTFKQSHVPGLELREYRIVQGQDSAAAILVDGKIVAAAAEERFDGKKHSGALPAHAIRYCASAAGCDVEEVDAFVHGFDYAPFRNHFALSDLSRQRFQEVYSRDAILRQFEKSLPEVKNAAEKLHHVQHHCAHAASAYYTSGWDECLVVVLDGMGEVDSITVWRGQGGKLTRIHSQTAEHSLGILYSLVTLHLGFDFNSDEYKIMGLAPYGDPARYRSFFSKHVELLEGGLLRIPILGLNRTPEDREVYSRTREFLSKDLVLPRDPEADVTDEHRDVAAALQECLNAAILHVCGHFAKATGLRRLAMAGGVALNCTANGELLSSGLFDQIYVQPAAADDGAALGAALAYAAEQGEVQNRRMEPPYLGPEYDESQMQTAIARHTDRLQVVKHGSPQKTCDAAARAIAAGEVVAWYRGRMEYGPRALGNRSILADPSRPEMRDRVNAMVKMREAFRPFAPAVTLDTVHKWFDVPEGTELPYMIIIVDVREQYRAGLPAITHVNGSARVQTVEPKSNPVYHQLLRRVGEITGKEMVLNTSFNVKGQPMVNTPREAVETFLNTGIDVLFLEEYELRRK